MIKIKEFCVVNQTSNNDCGLACLVAILNYNKVNITLEGLKSSIKYNGDCVSVYDILKLSRKHGIDCEGYKNVSLNENKLPSIVHLVKDEKQHFVVLLKVLKNKVLIMDPSIGLLYEDKEDFLKKYTGISIMFDKKDSVINNILSNKKLVFKTLILSVFITLLSVFLSFFVPVLIKLSNNNDKTILFIVILIFLLVSLLKDYSYFLKSKISTKFQLYIDKFITIPTINKIISLPHAFYHENGSGELISKVNDLSYIKDAIFSFVEVVIINVLLIVFCLITMSFLDIATLFINALFIFVFYYINHLFIRKNLSKSYDLQCLNEKLNNNLSDTFNSILIIKNLCKEKYFKEKIKSLYKMFLEKYKKLALSFQKKELLSSFSITFFSFIILSLTIIKNNTLSKILLTFSIHSVMTNALLEISRLLPLYTDFKNVNKRINDVINKKNLIETDEKIDIKTISIKNLFYSYGENKILNNVSLKIKKGDWIMINGPTGSGKSTLFKLITKQILYEGDEIYINDTNLDEISEEVIRNSITYVDQRIKLLNESIYENVFMGDNYDEKVTKTTLLDDLLKQKNNSHDYLIDNTNSNVSSGQIEKIAVAQALNANKEIIIFDETTSSLDVLTEERILKNIKDNYKDKTIILITHRKSNIKLFDKIITIENGKIKNYRG